MTTIFANYNYDPMIQFKPPKDPSFISQVPADLWLAGMGETHLSLRENINKALDQLTKYAGGKEMTFEVGDKVWLSTRNLKTSRP
jgi:hypothetical protein